MTDTHWPTMPLSGDATVQDPAEPPDEPWFTVLIEESQGSGDSIRWVAAPAGRTWRSRLHARAAAEDFARRYVPRHPMSEQARSVFRISTDEYLTIVDGAMYPFSFRVTVVEMLDHTGQ